MAESPPNDLYRYSLIGHGRFLM
ncbi:uncharacterized protein G2W53_042293 [Senna tora]|uniref:Uncharacterized protein n=1 Tax=Senna tora TaxID=362788 RepID=A0A834VZE1_9FABA|nr:uncharacterized protein G2W53_042293 [Senna tora]